MKLSREDFCRILSREEFCEEYGLSEDQFYGREIIKKELILDSLKELPEGCSLNSISTIYLNSLERLPEGCTLITNNLQLRSLKKLPEEYLIDSFVVWCSIIIPTFKGSSEFYYDLYFKRSFEKYSYIKESHLKFLRSDSDLEKALAEYFLKNTQENL